MGLSRHVMEFLYFTYHPYMDHNVLYNDRVNEIANKIFVEGNVLHY
jgi:hypothetical protein